MKRMTQEQYNEWVAKMCVEYSHSSFLTRLCDDGRTVIAVSRHGNRIGKAICHEDDTFDRRVGTAIAYARATGQEIPEVINEVRVDTLSYGDKFTYIGDSYIFVAKHPTKPNKYISVSEENGMISAFLWFTLVEKA